MFLAHSVVERPVILSWTMHYFGWPRVASVSKRLDKIVLKRLGSLGGLIPGWMGGHERLGIPKPEAEQLHRGLDRFCNRQAPLPHGRQDFAATRAALMQADKFVEFERRSVPGLFPDRVKSWMKDWKILPTMANDLQGIL